MEKLPEELWLLVVARVSPVESLANLRQASVVWQKRVDGSFIRYWVQQLVAGEQFAGSLDAGLQIVQHNVNGRGSFVHIFNPSLYLALHPSLDIS
jgi:hypothetical protein